MKLLALLLGGALSVTSLGATAYDAEIVSVIGKGETRPSTKADWLPATIKQQLDAGAFVRTGDLSQMALLLKDQTQLRLNQNSMLQIKEVSLSGMPTKLEMKQGRAWTQSKRKAVTSSREPVVTIQTPSATAAIRGTDWELLVDKDGSSTLTVLSGEVEFYNEQGRLSVRPNEQARADPGKAPTKQLLVNARERVQWVSAYRPQPRRWLREVPVGLESTVANIEEGRYAEALAALDGKAGLVDVALLLADLDLFLGRAGDAIQLLAPQASDPRAAALLVRAYLIDDKAEAARRQLQAALAKQPGDIELLLARGELARIDGDAPGALAAYRAAIVAQANQAEGWFGLGRVEAEREAVKAGRDALNRAIELNVKEPGYRGELATLETFANEFAAADKNFSEALARQPDDYVALTGLGILCLKQGQPDAALKAFLKAGVLEPRFARAAMYTGVAYYQLGNTQRAVEMFRRAAELDAKDPLPHMMLSLVASDRMAFGEAIAEARQAAELMPYLKSLNQLLNDQKGNANVGAALAEFGLEEWAQAYAHNAYTPYWAGSYLFLADRYSGTYNKNSELFKGFLSDPSVFGASNRFNSLVATPGHYATLGARLVGEDTQQRNLSAVLNGYSVTQIPFSYYLGFDRANVQPGDYQLSGDGKNLALGLGAKPSHELGLFLFNNLSQIDARTDDPSQMLRDTSLHYNSRRLDVGATYKFSPDSHAWLKVGSGHDDTAMRGNIFNQEFADLMNSIVDLGISPNGKVDSYRASMDQRDWQWRHTLDVTPDHQISWGVEFGQQERPVYMLLNFDLVNVGARIAARHESRDAYLSGVFKPSDNLTLQADIAYQQGEKRYVGDYLLGLSGGTPFTLGEDTEKRDIKDWNPRLGLAWKPAPSHALRLAAQAWRRPASVASLGPSDTAGIPLDDRLVSVGGKLQRIRAQYEWEANASTFVQGFVDHKQARNLPDPRSGIAPTLNLQDLERLRNRGRLSPMAIDLWEATPEFGAANVDSAGFAVNRLFTQELSGHLRYQYSQSENTGTGFKGNKVPWLPRHLFSVGADWLPIARWHLGAALTYRSERFIDEANTQRLGAGWNLGLRSYWEDAAKHWSVEAIVENLYSDKASSTTRSPIVGLQALYRF